MIEVASSPDGLNINDECGATSIERLQKVVVAEEADLGVALDGDGDRVIMVDGAGEEVDGDELLFIIATHLKELGEFEGGVVGTLMSNFGLEQAFKRADIHLCVPRWETAM